MIQNKLTFYLKVQLGYKLQLKENIISKKYFTGDFPLIFF